MKKLAKILLLLGFIFTIHYSLFTPEALAVCPVCTVAVGAGLGISQALGIDDAVTSVWIGGLILSSSFWIIDYLKRKKPEFPISNFQFPIIIGIYVLFLVPLWYGKYIGRLNNQIFGIDKILFGSAVGSLVFMLGKWLDEKVRKVKGKQLFIYQKVVFPVAGLLLTSIILDLIITKYSL